MATVALLMQQVVVGDQLTCKNIRAMKDWLLTEMQQKNRLQWAHEVPGKLVIQTIVIINNHLSL